MESVTLKEEYQQIYENRILSLREHESVDESKTEVTNFLNELKPKQLSYSGLRNKLEQPKYLCFDGTQASYYIGASWLVSDNQKINEKTDKAIVVTPKIDVDFTEMLITAFKFEKASVYFSNYYDINFNQPKIKTTAFKDKLTPLLLIHYISLLESIVKKGLKKDYVLREENLHSKVKGRILIQKNLQKNVFVNRQDRTFCRFQEYTIDTPENRLLKKALLFSVQMLSLLKNNKNLGSLTLKINWLKTAFTLVDDDIQVYQIKNLRTNKMFKEYAEAIKVAKMILRHYDYSISNVNDTYDQNSVPAFWIDMSRLYEVYVYSLLEEKFPNQILFQAPGKGGTAVDFVHKTAGIILDTKYKPRYKDRNRDIIPDIEELSRYARDIKILKNFSKEKRETVIPCVIIYPEVQILELEEDDEINEALNESDTSISGLNDINEILVSKNRIPRFLNFYKISVKLPASSEKF